MKYRFQLYGDGIHDDFPAIQEMLDSGVSSVYLPAPEKNYLISATLKIHSNQSLRLDRFSLIRLADHANCCMSENADPENWDANIALEGGIWDMNHNNQRPNVYHFPDEYGKLFADYQKEQNFSPDNRLFANAFSGHCFRFNSIKNFTFSNLTIQNPVVYGAQFGFIENFTVENITFDYTEGSPKLWNLDGVHFEGGCRNGVIRNLKGACHDDLVALTCDDGLNGDIENILIDGIIAEGCHSALRMLSYKHHIKNVHLTNVYGTFYLYVACMTKYYDFPGTVGMFENIVIDNVFASFCKGTVDVPGNYTPFLQIGDNVRITRLKIENFIREESVCNLPTIGIGRNTLIDNLEMDNVHLENKTGLGMACVSNEGTIKRFTAVNCVCSGASFLENRGIIDKADVFAKCL